MAATYLPKTKYNRLVATLMSVAPLLSVAPSAWTGTITEDEIKLNFLGEKLDIWPESIRKLDEEEED
ncbi:hypothetical protein [Nitrobacter sp.]|uniref:hypothetical protein n=1 Tax=Nitrobacter sp. TaxID=29420 RepID=UPI003F64FD3F